MGYLKRKQREALKVQASVLSPGTVPFLPGEVPVKLPSLRGLSRAPRCQGHIAQLPVGVLQSWKEAQAAGLPGPANLLLKDRGECHPGVNSPSKDLSKVSLVCFSVCPPSCISSDSKKTCPLINTSGELVG